MTVLSRIFISEIPLTATLFIVFRNYLPKDITFYILCQYEYRFYIEFFSALGYNKQRTAWSFSANEDLNDIRGVPSIMEELL